MKRVYPTSNCTTLRDNNWDKVRQDETINGVGQAGERMNMVELLNKVERAGKI